MKSKTQNQRPNEALWHLLIFLSVATVYVAVFLSWLCWATSICSAAFFSLNTCFSLFTTSAEDCSASDMYWTTFFFFCGGLLEGISLLFSYSAFSPILSAHHQTTVEIYAHPSKDRKKNWNRTAVFLLLMWSFVVSGFLWLIFINAATTSIVLTVAAFLGIFIVLIVPSVQVVYRDKRYFYVERPDVLEAAQSNYEYPRTISLNGVVYARPR